MGQKRRKLLKRPAALLLALLLASLGLPASPLEGLFKNPLSLGASPLPADKAFRVEAVARSPSEIALRFEVARGYYLYRDRIEVRSPTPGAELGPLKLPPGEEKEDPEFGRVEVYRAPFEAVVPVRRPPEGKVELLVHYQGCAERGICYPPQVKRFEIALPQASAREDLSGSALSEAPARRGPEASSGAPLAEEEQIASKLARADRLLVLLTFLGFGVLLAFTPCVFPTIPILAGILAGQGQRITPARGFLLALAYVLAHASVYALFGVVAALFGVSLQAQMQHPAVIAATALLFVLLALSMFGLYELQLPSRWQTTFDRLAMAKGGGSLLGAALMGGLSALVIGPCVAAPLAGALLYIARSGDLLLGGLALFAMGFGMGAPLLLVGLSAGKLLPRAGHWMHSVKAVFGVVFLGVALWLLERLLPAAVTVWLWALWLIVPAIYLGATTPLPREAGHLERLAKALGLCMLTYGLLLIVGAAAGNYDPLQPLRFLAERTAVERPRPSFLRVTTPEELEAAVAEARRLGKPLLLDFYADWCVSCKELERFTLSDPRVQEGLADFLLVRVDVTQNGPSQRALLARFGLIGPPALLFLSPAGEECRALRTIGYKPPEALLQSLREARQIC